MALCHMLAQRWIRSAPCSQWQLCMAAGLDKACVPMGILENFLRGPWAWIVLTEPIFRSLNWPARNVLAEQSSQSYFSTPFPITLSPLYETKLLPMMHVAYCSSCANITYYLRVKKKQRNNENIKGSLLWLRHYNSPRLLINRGISNTFLFLSKLCFSHL